ASKQASQPNLFGVGKRFRFFIFSILFSRPHFTLLVLIAGRQNQYLKIQTLQYLAKNIPDGEHKLNNHQIVKNTFLIGLMPLLMLSSPMGLSQQNIETYTKQVNQGYIRDFALQCILPEENMKAVLPQKIVLETKRIDTVKADPYTRSANVTVVIDNAVAP
ncbi:hypothetical protein, partial [Testudinibacter sp. TR-2022]|uniref:hypothetical protein n=1 Tax=Testudinibacter sp. TR-2022 TaxID=2585029 RepID=UPI00159BB871